MSKNRINKGNLCDIKYDIILRESVKIDTLKYFSTGLCLMLQSGYKIVSEIKQENIVIIKMS
ncbi:hypothetical protein FACS1894120_2540 [Clostridia bacterium]|nr:hypothetical protein FACS1894120_2540 [Clostridia bacterium]